MGFWNGFQLFLEVMGFWVDFKGFHGILLGFGVESVNKHQDSIYDLKKSCLHASSSVSNIQMMASVHTSVALIVCLIYFHHICSPRSTFGGHFMAPIFACQVHHLSGNLCRCLKITMIGFKSENNYQLSGKHFRKRSRISLLNSGEMAT